MKKFFLTGLALLIVSGLVFTSCSEDENINTNEAQQLSELSTSRLTSNYGSFEFENKTILINKDTLRMFHNDSLKYDFHYEGEMDYNLDETPSEVKISNIDNSDEFFKIQNLNVGEDVLTFDVLTSDDKFLKSIKYYPDSATLSQAKACGWCWVIPIVVGAVSEFMSESDCQTAIKACLQAGGLPNTTITQGVFSNSCAVICKPKPKTVN